MGVPVVERTPSLSEAEHKILEENLLSGALEFQSAPPHVERPIPQVADRAIRDITEEFQERQNRIAFRARNWRDYAMLFLPIFVIQSTAFFLLWSESAPMLNTRIRKVVFFTFGSGVINMIFAVAKRVNNDCEYPCLSQRTVRATGGIFGAYGSVIGVAALALKMFDSGLLLLLSNTMLMANAVFDKKIDQRFHGLSTRYEDWKCRRRNAR